MTNDALVDALRTAAAAQGNTSFTPTQASTILGRLGVPAVAEQPSFNRFSVGVDGGGNVRIGIPPVGALASDEALNLGCWLAVLSGATDQQITDTVAAIRAI